MKQKIKENKRSYEVQKKKQSQNMKKIIKIKPAVFPKRALSYNRPYIVLFRTDVIELSNKNYPFHGMIVRPITSCLVSGE